MSDKAIDVFIAYAQADAPLLERLRKQLAAAERIGLIDAWHDGEIEVGSDRQASARKAMQEAEIVILLLSADFFASEYLYEQEMSWALELAKTNQAAVLPVLLKDCTWQLTPLSKMRILPSNGVPVTDAHWVHPDRAFKQVVDEVIERSNEIRRERGAQPMAYQQSEPKKPEISGTGDGRLPKPAYTKYLVWGVILLGLVLGFFYFMNREKGPKELSGHQKTASEQVDRPNTNSSEKTNVQEESIPSRQPARSEQDAPKESLRQNPPTTFRGGSFKDARDRTTYQAIKLGDLYWMTSNLQYALPDRSRCYKDQAANCRQYGRMYDYDTALKICPKGWRLPSRKEWASLNAEQRQKLQLTLSGVYDRGGYRHAKRIGYYWTADRSFGGEAWAMEIRSGNRIDDESRYTHWGMVCRCVR